jgi:hypothetical protein
MFDAITEGIRRWLIGTVRFGDKARDEGGRSGTRDTVA